MNAIDAWVSERMDVWMENVCMHMVGARVESECQGNRNKMRSKSIQILQIESFNWDHLEYWFQKEFEIHFCTQFSVFAVDAVDGISMTF